MFSRRALLLASTLPLLSRGGALVAAQEQSRLLADTLGLLPPLDRLEGDPPRQLFGWTDLRALRDASPAGELATPVAAGRRSTPAIPTVPLDSAVHMNWDSGLGDLLGFSLDDVDQTLIAFEVRAATRVYHGRFDVDRIVATLTAQRYTGSSEGEWTLLTSPGGDEYDSDSAITGIVPFEFNYLLVSESIIITAGARVAIDAVLTAAETGRNLNTNLAPSALPRYLEGSTAASFFDGQRLKIDRLRMGSVEFDAELPRAAWFAADMTLSGDRVRTRFLVEFDLEVADRAASVIRDRLETGESSLADGSYQDLFGPVEVAVIPDTGIVEIAGEDPIFSRNWFLAIYGADLLFIATV